MGILLLPVEKSPNKNKIKNYIGLSIYESLITLRSDRPDVLGLLPTEEFKTWDPRRERVKPEKIPTRSLLIVPGKKTYTLSTERDLDARLRRHCQQSTT